MTAYDSRRTAPARGPIDADLAAAFVLFVVGAVRFLAAPVDGSEVNGAVFGAFVALGALVWLTVAAVRRTTHRP